MEIGKFLTGGDLVADVPFGEGDAPAIITIRYLPTERIVEILKKVTKIVFNAKHQPEEKTDNAKYKQLLGEAAVLGWSGITADGVEVPFSPEARDRMMASWTDFAKFVVDTCDDLQRLAAAEREAVRGN